MQKTVFKINTFLSSKHVGKFYAYLDRFDDAAGKHLLDNVEDLLASEPGAKSDFILSRISKDIVERINSFCLENEIDLAREYLAAQKEERRFNEDPFPYYED